MRLYLVVHFWVGIVGILAMIAIMSIAEYPRQEKPKSVGNDTFRLVVMIIYLVWCSYLLFVVGVQ